MLLVRFIRSGNAVTGVSLSGSTLTVTKGNPITLSTSGSGNAVTGVSLSGSTLTVTKGNPITLSTSGSGNAVTGVSLSGSTLTVTKGNSLVIREIFYDLNSMMTYLVERNTSSTQYYYEKTIVSGKLVYRSNTSGMRYVYTIIDYNYYKEYMGGSTKNKVALVALSMRINDYDAPSEPLIVLLTDTFGVPSGYGFHSFEGIVWGV